jgi:serine/threonine protein phosphatase PrpC
MKLIHISKTDVGLVRPANEDSIGSIINNSGVYSNIYIVCDGMGGHVGGARASQTAIRSIEEYFKNTPDPTPNIALNDAIEFANMQIFGDAESNPEFKGMGTTVTLMVESEGLFYIAHVGDSRVYINTDKKLYRLTKDHSFVQTLVDAGQLTDAEMETHPRKNELTRALGIAMEVDVEVAPQPIRAKSGDKFLLCSDGLCGLINDTMILTTINAYSELDATVDELIELAKKAGGHDNISADLIEVIESDFAKTKFVDKNNVPNTNTGTQEVKIPSGPTKPKMDKKLQILLSLVVLIVLAVGGNFLINQSNSEKQDNGGGIEDVISDSTKTSSNDKLKDPIEISDTISEVCEEKMGYLDLSHKLTLKYEDLGFEACAECQKIKVKESGEIYSFNEKRKYNRAKKSLKAGDILFVLKTDLAKSQSVKINGETESLIDVNRKAEEAEKEKLAKEKLAKEEAEKEKLAKEKLAKEEAEKEKLAKEEAEKEKLAKEKLAKEKLAKEEKEKAKEKEKAEQKIESLLNSEVEFWKKHKLNWKIDYINLDLSKDLQDYYNVSGEFLDGDNEKIILYNYKFSAKSINSKIDKIRNQVDEALSDGYTLENECECDIKEAKRIMINLIKISKNDEWKKDGSISLYKKEV